MNNKLVTVITATIANELLINNIKSVLNQTHDKVQHLIFVDGADHWEKVDNLIRINHLGNSNIDIIKLPYSVGKDRYNGHRMYAAGSYLAEGEFLMFLDDDNTISSNHIETCLKMIDSSVSWTYSFRNIVDKEQNFICQDNCESLGEWSSVLNPNDFFVDMNCYFLPKQLALAISPLMYRKFREPGQMEVDRAMIWALKRIAPNFKGTKKYTVNYTVGNSPISVQKDFFINGNKTMLEKYGGKYPWSD